jgi:hypothetical protein
MKRTTWLILLVFAMVGLASTSAQTNAAGEEATVTAAARGVFGAGAALNSVSVQNFDLGTGVFIGPDGSASGPINVVLYGRSVLGQAQQIIIDGTADRGAVGPNGRAYFSGLATINLGAGTPLVANVPFTVNAADNSLVLTINSTALPIAGITAGTVSVE